MSLFSRSFSVWFGYSRGERRASFLLLLIILIVLSLRIFIRKDVSDLRQLESAEIFKEAPLSRDDVLYQTDVHPFTFDPNTASASELKRLGLNSHQIKALVNYRNKGGVFRKARDLSRIYGLDTATLKKLEPYVIISAGEPGKVLHNSDTASRDRLKPHFFRTVELNSCDSSDLENLPGLGPVLSARIIRYRKLLGGFYSKIQVMEVYGVTDSLFRVFSDRLTVDTTMITRIDIDSAAYEVLSHHPYMRKWDVKTLIKYRKYKGSVDSIGELIRNRIISPADAQRVKPYLMFGKGKRLQR